MALASGAAFAGYTVERMLSSSATGELYLAQRPGYPGWQALKVLPSALSADGDFRRRFHEETRVAASMYHLNVVEVHDRGEFEGRLWIAMEYVEGTDASQLMAERFPTVLPVAEALPIVTAAAAALDFAHQRGLLHRDVRPANILLTMSDDPRILLTDFGLVRPASESAYAAPEELAGGELDGRADQYSLAATAMHLLSGMPPSGRTALRELRPDLERLDTVLARALGENPADRFGSCRDLAAALNERSEVPDRSHVAFEPPPVVEEPAYVVDYPAYGWPEPPTAAPGPALVERPAAVFPGSAGPPRRGPRRILIGIAAVLLLVGLFAAGVSIGRKTSTSTSTQAGSPATTTTTAASTTPSGAPAAAPTPLDGTYLIRVQRSKQTFDNTPTPQPPDVATWWAIRSACTPTRCLAAATLLNDRDHTREKSPDVHPLLLEFQEGQWRSRPETTKFPCIGPTGMPSTQTTVQVVAFSPQPQGSLVGEMTVTVKTDECGQQGGVIRIPTQAGRTGDIAPGVNVPDPIRVTPTTSDPPTVTSTAPTTTHR
ncbi:serine/threonine protein kinase [Mycobacterium asiaticum]|uniref:non-specific serine/threonine protein kinase n=1 Tax=Mycobacterium asiaticum TaxID=1790 RepID=A0A1A3MV19_MYCAS|nr:serine/threonine-protein kinase [Mycobacterium asiaticum]OBK12910.1 serine/threonine protein kinase [Mycobacterium asiaticum]